MRNKGFEYTVYKEYFGDLKNVRTVPQEKHEKKPERINVHYPLAKEIATGGLIQYPAFDSYTQKNVLVLCNLRINVSHDGKKDIRPWRKKNPDIVTLTSQGEILAIECKNEAKFQGDEIDRMARTFITLIDLAGPYTLANKTPKDGWSKWSFLYRSCYEKENRFPPLEASLSELFSFQDVEKKIHWAQLIMDYIKSRKLRYIVAFAGASKRDEIQKMIREFKMNIRKYEPLLTNLTEQIFFLSMKNGKIQDLYSAKDCLD